MALTDENGMVLPVTPMGGNGNNGFGNGDLGWLVLIILLANGGMWGGFGGGFGNMALGYDFPWLLNGQNNINANTNNGFRDAMLNDGINGIRDGINGVQTQLCNGFAGVNATINATSANAETAANSRAMANMQQIFGVSQQLADCCCENRLATCQTQNIIQNEGNQTRFADANNTRDLLQNQTANTQAILDKLCQLELDAKNDKINDLERQLTSEQLKASQIAQNAFISQGFSDEVDALYNRLNNCPVPTTPVYGRTPIFTCNNNGCGCGCGNNF